MLRPRGSCRSGSGLQRHALGILPGTDSVPLPDRFWQQFEETLSGPEGGYDATSITVAVAS